MMNITERQLKELEFARSLGVIKSIDKDHLQKEMNLYNSKAGEHSFGKTSHNEYSFVGYFLARFRMDFVFEKLNYEYRFITKEDISNYYEDNKIVFFRENRECFGLEEVEEVIIKRLRELEYEEAIDGLLY